MSRLFLDHLRKYISTPGSSAFIDEYVRTRNIPIPKLLEAFGIQLVCYFLLAVFVVGPNCELNLCTQCPELQDRRPKTMLYFLRVAISHQSVVHSSHRSIFDVRYRLRNRDKLPQYNTIADAVQLIKQSQRILILTGAGISKCPIYPVISLTHSIQFPQVYHVVYPISARGMVCTRLWKIRENMN